MIIRVRDLMERLRDFEDDRFIIITTKQGKRRSILEVDIDAKLCVNIKLRGFDDK